MRIHFGRTVLQEDAAGGGGETLTLETGSFAITGVALNGRVNSPLAQGSLALTGQQIHGRINSPLAAGAYNWTGNDLGLFKSIILALDPGNFTITGSDLHGRITSPLDAGSFEITGIDLNEIFTPGAAPQAVVGGQLRKRRLEVKADEWLALEAEREAALAELEQLADKRGKRIRDRKQVAKRRIAAVEHAMVEKSEPVEDDELLMIVLALAAG